MPKPTIKYQAPKTLKVLKSLGKYLDFKISSDPASPYLDDIFVPGDHSVDISDSKDVFTGKGLDAKKLRETAWNRNR